MGLRISLEVIPLPQIIKEDEIDEEMEEKEKIIQQQKVLEIKEKQDKERGKARDENTTSRGSKERKGQVVKKNQQQRRWSSWK